MKREIPFIAAIFLFFDAAIGVGIRADELKLKDGSKIVGTIVGFEENSFKVKTSYGFAVVQKDQVVSVKIEDASVAVPETNPAPTPEKAPAKSAPPPAKPPTKSAELAKQAARTSPPEIPSNAVAERPPTPTTVYASPPSPPPSSAPAQVSAQASPSSSPAHMPALAPTSQPAPPPAQPTPPAKPALPPPIREEVTGNTYTNDTYAFRMYKPPDWDVIASAQTILPGSVAAMGTADQTTYLIIGVEPVGKSMTGSIEATEKRLSGMLENFRDTGEQQITVAGLSAIEKHFHGSVDDRDWSGVVVFLPRAGNLYTIFGMTYADSDLVQIQENVITRAISSLQFLPQ